MIETPMKSTFITMVQYNPDPSSDQEMIVQFKNGTRESYLGVSKHLHDAFIHAESQGSFWNQNFKGRGIPVGAIKPENWMLYGSAIEDISCGDRIEMDASTGRVRRAQFKSLAS